MTGAAAERCDVAVIGAGPAGAACARALAARGRRVVLLDAARHPRVKVCGGGVVRRAALELGFEPPGLPLFAAEMHARDAGVAVRVERAPAEGPLLWMTMRAELDLLLAEAARDAGADLRHPCAVRDLCVEPDRARLSTDAGPLEAAFVVCADGALSRTAALAGWREPPQLAPALEWEIEVAPERAARFAGAGRFDFDCVPDGYGWVFPKGGGHLSVGVLAWNRGARDLRPRLEAYLAALGLAERVERDRRGYVIPLAPRPGPPARGRALLAGDAYGLADPLTAEGISPALISGRLAAEAICGEREPAAVARAYARALERALLRDFAAARRLARVLYGSPRWRRRILGAFGEEMCAAMALQIEGAKGYRELLLDPRSYARLFFARATRSRARASASASPA